MTLTHDGRRDHKKVHRADSEGDIDIDIDKTRANTKGADVFKVEKIGGSTSRTIRMR